MAAPFGGLKYQVKCKKIVTSHYLPQNNTDFLHAAEYKVDCLFLVLWRGTDFILAEPAFLCKRTGYIFKQR